MAKVRVVVLKKKKIERDGKSFALKNCRNVLTGPAEVRKTNQSPVSPGAFWLE